MKRIDARDRHASTWPSWLLFVACILVPVMAFPIPPVMGMERLVLADTPTLLTGLVTLARELGYFREEGLVVEMTRHPTGDEALAEVEAGRAQVATVAETAFVLRMLAQPGLRALALIGSCDSEVKILARRDAGIKEPSDLRGKRIATQKRLSTHFFLDQFLLKHGLSLEEVTPLFRKLPELPDLIASGQADAISTRDPFLSQARERLGDNGVVFEAPGLYDKVYLLAVRAGTVLQRPAALDALLLALIRAETFVRERTDEARVLLARLLPGENPDAHWTHHIRLRVWLDHRFVLTLENVASWAIRHHLTAGDTVPNFLSNLDPGPLRRVRPMAVNLLE